MLITIIAGARPNFMKIAPIIHAIQKSKKQGNNIDFSEIKMIHAHTWYSDGGVAYLLSKKYNIPYITAVRNTDLNVHYKYLLHHRKFGKEILKNANKV